MCRRQSPTNVYAAVACLLGCSIHNRRGMAAAAAATAYLLQQGHVTLHDHVVEGHVSGTCTEVSCIRCLQNTCRISRLCICLQAPKSLCSGGQALKSLHSGGQAMRSLHSGGSGPDCVYQPTWLEVIQDILCDDVHFGYSCSSLQPAVAVEGVGCGPRPWL